MNLDERTLLHRPLAEIEPDELLLELIERERGLLQDCRRRILALERRLEAVEAGLGREAGAASHRETGKPPWKRPANWLRRRARDALTILGGPFRRPRLLLITPAYPGGSREYGGEFVRARVEAYHRVGIDISVFHVSPDYPTPVMAVEGGIPIQRGSRRALRDLIKLQAATYTGFLVHFINQEIYDALKRRIGVQKMLVWIHGYEARDYKRLAFNFTAEELASRGEALERIHAQRMTLMRRLLPDRRVGKIFVSNFIRGVVEEDAAVRARQAQVIPNFIDGELFCYHPKPPEQRLRILLVRPFKARNYANDLAVKAISLLAERPGFDELSFTIRGFGPLFDETIAPLRGFANVDIREGYLGQAEIAALHRTHGIMLVPTRYDTQGVTLGEAMSSGLVAITNRVAAIPEFVDDDSAIAVPGEDHAAIAAAVEALVHAPERFAALSARAAQRVRRQCGYEATIARELRLMTARLPLWLVARPAA